MRVAQFAVLGNRGHCGTITLKVHKIDIKINLAVCIVEKSVFQSGLYLANKQAEGGRNI